MSMKPYTVSIGGIDHTVLLTDEDAEMQGLKAVPTKERQQPKNKARVVVDKAATVSDS